MRAVTCSAISLEDSWCGGVVTLPASAPVAAPYGDSGQGVVQTPHIGDPTVLLTNPVPVAPGDLLLLATAIITPSGINVTGVTVNGEAFTEVTAGAAAAGIRAATQWFVWANADLSGPFAVRIQGGGTTGVRCLYWLTAVKGLAGAVNQAAGANGAGNNPAVTASGLAPGAQFVQSAFARVGAAGPSSWQPPALPCGADVSYLNPFDGTIYNLTVGQVMPSSTSLHSALHSALCGKVRKDEVTAILDNATHATISADLKNMIRSAWGESAAEEIISHLSTTFSTAPSEECVLKTASNLGLAHAEFLTLLAAVV